MTKESVKAMREYRAAFMTVLGHLDAEGVAMDKAHRVLGVTKREFNKCALAAAVATWDASMDDVVALEKKNSVLGRGMLLAQLGNVHEVLVLLGADVSSDAGFAALGITKQVFDMECREAVLGALMMVETGGVQMAIQYGDWDFVNNVYRCMCAGGISPSQDQIYKDAGLKSRAHFEAVYADCKDKAARIRSEAICPLNHNPS